ncbi:MAG: hypothetical protein U1F65_12530 [Verrucomicrobiota bacterium]
MSGDELAAVADHYWHAHVVNAPYYNPEVEVFIGSQAPLAGGEVQAQPSP